MKGANYKAPLLQPPATSSILGSNNLNTLFSDSLNSRRVTVIQKRK